MRIIIPAILTLILCLCLAGCGNVYLRGEALTAAETSAVDAVEANRRAADTPAPDWLKAYLAENSQQWKSFVQAAKDDTKYVDPRWEVAK